MQPNRHPAIGLATVVGVLTVLAAWSAAQNTAPPSAPAQSVLPPAAPAESVPSMSMPQSQSTPAAQPQAASTEGADVLTRGPIHEAFAETAPLNPEPGIVVPKAPPEAIDEVPPAERPAGGDSVWIPGYWGWDQDRQAFLWVSGVWRIPPPGAERVPGYWTQTDSGYQWIAGYWRYGENPHQQQQVTYLPQPPATVEAGPSSPAPGDSYFWVPGCWIWRDAGYVWQAGYWAQGVPDWVWTPAYYLWTPGGCVFVAGHWDYPLERRGVLFAPIYFQAGVYMRPGFRYTPSVIINTSVIETTLFAWPRYCHYYFGDYYASSYANIGIVPWFTLHINRRGYDPLFAYAYWRDGRRNPQWLTGLHTQCPVRPTGAGWPDSGHSAA